MEIPFGYHQGQEDYITLYKGFGKEVLEMYFSSTISYGSHAQRQTNGGNTPLDFDCLVNEVASEQAARAGLIVLRGALMVARIASTSPPCASMKVLMQMKEYICTDEDFTASTTSYKPSSTTAPPVASSLPGEKMKPQPMQSYFRIRSVVESLPRIFTYSTPLKRKH